MAATPNAAQSGIAARAMARLYRNSAQGQGVTLMTIVAGGHSLPYAQRRRQGFSEGAPTLDSVAAPVFLPGNQ